MEEILDHKRTETCFVLFCSTIGSYVRGYAEGIVTFNSFYPRNMPALKWQSRHAMNAVRFSERPIQTATAWASAGVNTNGAPEATRN